MLLPDVSPGGFVVAPCRAGREPSVYGKMLPRHDTRVAIAAASSSENADVRAHAEPHAILRPILSRTLRGTLLLGLLAILATSALTWLAYRGISRALVHEFERRVSGLAAATATQISADDIEDARLRGDEGSGYATLQLQLEELRATTALENASLFDSARSVIYDCRGLLYEHEVTRLDTLARASVAQALAGLPTVSPPFRLPGGTFCAGFAPVMGAGGRVAGVVAVEAKLDYLETLAGVRRSLITAWLVLSAALALFALLLLRAARGAERLERQLVRSDTLAAMGRLTASLAHEIKNPLAIIRGSATRLGRLAPDAQRMADFVVDESDRLSRTVARYLQFARGSEPGAGPGDADASLAATLELLEAEARQRAVRFEREGERAAAPVTLDDESLKQIYLNILLNAIEAMPQGGVIRVGIVTHHGKVEVRVTDQGPGLTDEQLRQLGTPFQSSKPQGSGLGFFLSQRLAQSAGGTLALENAAGGGACCTLRLPAAP